jgi:hypothetical protein
MSGLKLWLILILSTAATCYSFSQSNGDQYFSDRVETVQIFPPGEPLGEPVLSLGDGSSTLELHFDIFGAELENLEYTFIHCDADWKISDLMPNEYLDGYTESYIEDYQFSFNTRQPYIHYMLQFPQTNMNFIKSGNYLLKVYPEDNPENPLFVKRFFVVDPRITMAGTAKPATSPALRNTHQEVDFEINIQPLKSQFPSREIRVFIRQNGRLDNMVKDLQPLSVTNGIMNFDLEKENIFKGTNSFRYFDFSSMKFNSEYLDRIDVSGDVNKVYLLEEQVRRFKEFKQGPDFHGRYYIDTKDWSNPQIEAEYSDVFFRFQYDAPLLHGDVYLIGELANWSFTPYNKMVYNFETKAYEATLYLKQGFYSYNYGFVAKDSEIADITFFENSHYQTQNQYFIFVYFRATGTTFDQLVGLHVLSTNEL